MGIAAAMLARDAVAHGVLREVPPARRITAQQAIDGSVAGFYGHGETNPGTRYDPGQNFDWDLFLATYAAAVGGGINYQSVTISQEDELSAQFEVDARGEFDSLRLFQADVRGELDKLRALDIDLRGDLANKGALTAANGKLVELLAGRDGLDAQAIIDGVTAAIAERVKITATIDGGAK
jgi:hypothetical protein